MRLPRHARLGLVVSLCFVPGVADGQPAKEVNQQYQFWASLNSTTRVTDRLGAIADVHVRRNDFLADPSFDLGYMLVYQQKARRYQYDLNHPLRRFFHFTPDLRKVKSSHHPASGEK